MVLVNSGDSLLTEFFVFLYLWVMLVVKCFFYDLFFVAVLAEGCGYLFDFLWSVQLLGRILILEC